jgi:hypothetical protein
MTAPPELPLSFRQELVPHLFKAVAGGWSCAVVGLPGFGLSNLLRFMVEPRVAEHYLGGHAAGGEAGQSLMVYVEADRLLDPAALFAGLARQMVAAAHAQQWPRADQAALRRLADMPSSGTLAEPAEPLAGLINHVCGDLERRVVFVCDEFDTALLGLPGAYLRELRALRDAHKYRLAFVAGLRRDAAWVAAARAGHERVAGAAKFAELFDQHTFPLRPYSRADAGLAIARKAVGWAQPPSQEQQDQLYHFTGGHAKLLIASLIYLEPRLHLPWANVERGLLAEPGLAEICRMVWEALETGDRRALWLLAHDRRDSAPETGLKRLELLGLAVGGPAFIFSSILEAFLLAQAEPPAPGDPAPVSHLRDPEATVYW